MLCKEASKINESCKTQNKNDSQKGDRQPMSKKQESAQPCTACCCGPESDSISTEAKEHYVSSAGWTIGHIPTSSGDIPQASARLNFRDFIGSWKARWEINRMKYQIKPGLYGIGNPDKDSPVLVSANYKMSFDRLRKELSGMDAWIMVLDTKGINVWCAAGKGTFGTDEIVNRINEVDLSQIVSHKKLILPQLGAPGVAAHEISKKTGFKVIYGPIKAKDLPKFIKSGMKATPEMRRVMFTFFDRVILTPVEVVGALRPLLIVFGVLLILTLPEINLLSFRDISPYLGAIVVGAVLVPALLPWIPGKAFALKGWIMGMIWAFAVSVYQGWLFSASTNWNQSLILFLLLPAISSFLAMNFTGSSTYTSLSGVVREMKYALPLIIISASLGVVLMAINLFI